MSVSPSDDFSPRRRASTLAPILMGAACAAVALAGRTRIGAWLRGFLEVAGAGQQADPIRRRLDAGWSLPRLRDAILGRHKAVLLARYGAPQSAALNHVVLTGPDATAPAALRADTWYYLLDPAARTAMSIRFHGSIATEVEFFDAP